MTDAELDRCKTLLASSAAAKPQTTVYDPARETLRGMVEDEERKREKAAWKTFANQQDGKS